MGNSLTNYPNGLSSFGIPVIGGINGIPLTGTWWFVDPVNGTDGHDGQSPDTAFATLYKAVASAADGNNDVIVLIGNGQSSGSARLSLALAQTQNAALTAGTLLWNKNALHLLGMCAPTGVSQRARIAPPSGVYTQATFGSGNFVVVTGSGCIFANFSVFHGFSTGGVSQIAWTDNGSRNAYLNVDLGGMGDAASATDTASRSLKIGSAGSGENTFVGCTIGLDTVDRTVANASLEFAGGTARNTFKDCLFPVRATNAGVLSVLATGASAVDRWQRFKECAFINAMSSGGTAQTVIMSMTNAAPGGLFAIENSWFIGDASTNWGDANALANSYINMALPSAGNGGIGIKPT